MARDRAAAATSTRVEFFAAASRRLKPGGVMCTWAPTPRVAATFRAVFPHVLEAAERRGPDRQPRAARLRARGVGGAGGHGRGLPRAAERTKELARGGRRGCARRPAPDGRAQPRPLPAGRVRGPLTGAPRLAEACRSASQGPRESRSLARAHSEGRWSNASPRLRLVGLDRDLDLDLVPDEDAALVEGLVPVDPVVLAVRASVEVSKPIFSLPQGSLPSPRKVTGQRDRLRHAVHREVAGDVLAVLAGRP